MTSLQTASSIWIGGTSDLTKTYLEELQLGGHFFLAAPSPPSWPPHPQTTFVPLDLACGSSVANFTQLLKLHGKRPSSVIFGARASLVFDNDGHSKLTGHLETLLESLIKDGVSSVVNISSVAVANHVKEQLNISEDSPLPPLTEYTGEYDKAKRATEEIITKVCHKHKIHFVHLRLSGIFSNPMCIQMRSLGLQLYCGCDVQTKIDFNSSRNVCHAIRILMHRMRTYPESVSSEVYVLKCIIH
jgi:nucleoside-diphosphate-sugar epimerase